MSMCRQSICSCSDVTKIVGYLSIRLFVTNINLADAAPELHVILTSGGPFKVTHRHDSRKAFVLVYTGSICSIGPLIVNGGSPKSSRFTSDHMSDLFGGLQRPWGHKQNSFNDS